MDAVCHGIDQKVTCAIDVFVRGSNSGLEACVDLALNYQHPLHFMPYKLSATLKSHTSDVRWSCLGGILAADVV